MKIDGSCHCGFLTYEAEVDPADVGICHCADCQKLTGTAFRTTVFAAREAFRLISGVPATYVKIGVFLTLITVAEVWAYYIPELVAAKGLFITLLLVMSAVKFFTVVALYMHLKYDHRIFRAFFVGPFIVAAGTMMGLMFLFGKLAIRLGILN